MLTPEDLLAIKDTFQKELRPLERRLKRIEDHLGVVERTLIRLDSFIHQLADRLDSHIEDHSLHYS